MLIVCPNCKKRFDVDAAILGESRKLRCSACKAVFRLVRKGEAPRVREPEPEAPAARIKVVVANESAAFCEAVRKVLAPEPFEIFICNDGKVALETVERVKPEVLLLDVALPTMFGFEVCERVRQNPSLAGIKMVLIASIYDKTRYKRSPNSLYGADDYIEKHHIPDQLVPMIYRLTSVAAPQPTPTERELAAQEESRSELREAEVRETSAQKPASPAPAAAPAPAPEASRTPQAVQPAPGPAAAPGAAAFEYPAVPAADRFPVEPPIPADPAPPAAARRAVAPAPEEVAWLEPAPAAPTASAAPAAPAASQVKQELPEAHVKAKRLARIIVSDIVLYNQGKVEQGVREGNLYTLLADDIREGEALYRQRVPQDVRDSTTFLKDAFEDLIAKKRAELRL